MARITPRPPPTQAVVLSCLNRCCPVCGGPLWFAYDNARTVTTLEVVLGVTLQVRRCVNPACAFYHRPYTAISTRNLNFPAITVIYLDFMLRLTIEVIKRARVQTSGKVTCKYIFPTRNRSPTFFRFHVQGGGVRPIYACPRSNARNV